MSNNTAPTYCKHNDIIKENEDGVVGNAYFYSLCRPRHKRKKRTCVKCRNIFNSSGPHNQICAQCKRSMYYA